ncbi:MAG: nitronate monooxygenase [Dehalococcoidia bacterium]|nr:MAG: nitronate monooxygenase [Dehalococcoidia bacterium]
MTSKIKTRVTEILGVEHPIVMGTMGYQSFAEFVAAAANAGIFACLASVPFRTTKELKEEIRKTKSLTDKPFGLNINLFPMLSPLDPVEYTDAAIEEGVPVIETSGRSPEHLVERIKSANVRLMHKCVGVRHAVTAERLGADLVEVVGYEAAGHPGRNPVGSFVLFPLVADAVKIPVIAGGGIGDARGIVAALALGAEGVCIGSVFMATQECPVHQNIKQRLIEARETDTTLTFHSKGDPMRALRNALTEHIEEMEQNGASMEDILEIIGGGKGKHAAEIGEADWTIMSIGQVVAQIHDVPTVKELVERLMNEVTVIRERLNSTIG